MGQLERYGLYVLVLVIFLILGVAIWGNDPAHAGPPNAVRDVRDALGDSSGSGKPLVASERETSLSEAYRGHFEIDPWRDPEARQAKVEPGAKGAAVGPNVLDDLQPADSGVPSRRTAVEPAPSDLPDLRVHKIQKNDILGNIAKRYLGSSRKDKVDAILALNPRLDEKRLLPGTTIRIPHTDEVLAQHGRPVRGDKSEPARTTVDQYVVKKGDSAWKISKRLFGTPKHMKALLEANGLKESTVLKPGSVLRVPQLEED